MNVIFLIGNLGKDPEVRSTNSGSSVANFSIATTERWRDSEGERQEKTTWHDCVVWGSLTKVVNEWVVKGMKVAVVGRLEKRKWEDKEGNTRYQTEVVVERLEMLSKPEEGRPSRHKDDVEDEEEDEEEERPRKRKSAPPKRSSKGKGKYPGSKIPDDLDDDIPF